MSSLNYLDLCRLCLVKERVTVPIFEGEGDTRQIYLKITACLPVKVDREDKLPKKICNDCVYKVEFIYDFWNTSASSQKKFLEWLGEDGLEDKPNYATNVLNQNIMKSDPNGGNRLDGSMMQQVSEHQNNIGMGMMDNINLSIPMIMSSTNQQQITSVPMDTSVSSVQSVQEMPGTSTQSTHEQITQSQTNTSNQQEEEEESSEEEENSEDECDGDEGLPVKEENEEDPNNSRVIEPTTFVNVSLACDEAGPSGLQQQKVTEIPEMAMQQNAEGDPKSGQQKKKSQDMHECIKCRARFRHMMKLVEHLKNLHSIERAFHCDECGKAFRSPMNITRHKLIHTGQKKFTCDICDYASNQKSNLESHLRRHRKDYVYKCEKCNKGFFDRAEYEEHFNVHVKDKYYQCEYCKKLYLYKKNLTRHLKTQHANLSSNTNVLSPTTNKLIGKIYLSDEKLLKNKSSKVITRKYLCDLCGKALSSHNRLAIHRRVHTGEKIANCEMCAKKFTSKENLKIHLRIHTGEKPHICSECGRRFTQRTSLVMHLRYHSGDRPFKCPDCDKSFISSTFLKNHRKVHDKGSINIGKVLIRDGNSIELDPLI